MPTPSSCSLALTQDKQWELVNRNPTPALQASHYLAEIHPEVMGCDNYEKSAWHSYPIDQLKICYLRYITKLGPPLPGGGWVIPSSQRYTGLTRDEGPLENL
ncbi:hypothetical protein DSO57_1035627 [Entomophthora muscae]|uniref:Uncharacterized protein n=1 Tax=Entomophthora muscae TaxID=34485 RepID=A0ACC2TY05_9FUNG|nr:hypothetical protein DSO57_1035627 [Entomophthora muscae]